MEDYLNFNNEDLIKELTERLRIEESKRGFLERCCIAYQYEYEQQEKRLKDLQTLYSQSLEQRANMAKTQAKMAETQAKMAELLAKRR